MPRLSATGERLCGTPGCELLDFHTGPCSTDVPASKRPRYCPGDLSELPKKRQSTTTDGDLKAQRRTKQKRPIYKDDDGDGDGNGDDDERPRSPIKPAQQDALPSGLQRFYHVHRWGVPLMMAPWRFSTGSSTRR